MRHLVLLTGALLLAPALTAQSVGAQQLRVPTAADSAILRSLDFPRIIQRARAAGVPDSTLRYLLGEMRTRGLPAVDASAALETEVEVVEKGGNADNFGQFVKTQVKAGLRGQELAASIRAERARRGMGPDRVQRNDRSERDRTGRPDDSDARSNRDNPPSVNGRPAGSNRPNPDSTRGKPAPSSVRRP